MQTLSGYRHALFAVGIGLLIFALFNMGAEGIRLIQGKTQWQRLPSSYDRGLTVPEAATKTEGRPLLIEFYQDRCLTCRRVTPLLHGLQERGGWNRCAQSVMVDADKPENAPFVQLFGVTELPAVFFFWPGKMRKIAVPFANSATAPQLAFALNQGWQQLMANTDGQIPCSAVQSIPTP
jgi:thiol:disulfide interchange protein